MRIIVTHPTTTVRITAILACAMLFMTGCQGVSVGGGRAGSGNGGLISTALNAGVKGIQNESLSESDEQGMGESVAMEVSSKYPITSNQKLNQYVTLVGLTLANNCRRPDLNWLFAVLETPEANAFSGPNGFIFVTRGLLAKMHDEAELAGVLAHEMSHVLEKHGLNAVKQAGRANVLASLATADKHAAAFSELTSSVTDTILVKGYDREQEDNADLGAIKLAFRSGYNPNSYLNFITRLASEQKTGSSLMSTHKGAAERAQIIRKKLSEMKAISAAPSPGVILQDRFEKNVRQ